MDIKTAMKVLLKLIFIFMIMLIIFYRIRQGELMRQNGFTTHDMKDRTKKKLIDDELGARMKNILYDSAASSGLLSLSIYIFDAVMK